MQEFVTLKYFKVFFKEDSKEKSEVQIENEIAQPIIPHVISFHPIPQIIGTEEAVILHTKKRKMQWGREVTGTESQK